ncbi:MAG: hypothetical protein RID53_07650 [Coleofasciculus sp. B1-GNL1-01]
MASIPATGVKVRSRRVFLFPQIYHVTKDGSDSTPLRRSPETP